MKYIKTFSESANTGLVHRDFGDYEKFRTSWEEGEKNTAPISIVTTQDGKKVLGTFQYGTGFKANPEGEKMGLKSGKKLPSFPDGSYPKIQHGDDDGPMSSE